MPTHWTDKVKDEQLKQLDLSCWEIALNAAEPLKLDSIERFKINLDLWLVAQRFSVMVIGTVGVNVGTCRHSIHSYDDPSYSGEFISCGNAIINHDLP